MDHFAGSDGGTETAPHQPPAGARQGREPQPRRIHPAAMSTARKRPRGKRRELAPLEPVDAKDGPAMLALPSDRHRAFVRPPYTVRPGHDTTENFKNAAQVMARISELAAKYRVRLPAPRVDAPGIIDGEFSEVNVQAAE